MIFLFKAYSVTITFLFVFILRFPSCSLKGTIDSNQDDKDQYSTLDDNYCLC